MARVDTLLGTGRAVMLAATLAALLLASGAPARAQDRECPEAWLHLNTGDPAGAEEKARACLQANPLSAEAAMLLSRALARQDRLVEALNWADGVHRRHPQDADVTIWTARLRAWQGDLGQAWAMVKDLPPDRADAEDLRFLADLAFWRHDSAEAASRYDRVVRFTPSDRRARLNRGLSRRDSGDMDGALADFDELCRLGERESCLLSDRVRISRSNLSAYARFDHWTVLERPDAYSWGAGLSGRTPGGSNVGLSLEMRPRFYSESAFGDLFSEVWYSRDPAPWATIRVAAGVAVRPRYSPLWALQVEPIFRPWKGGEVGLMVWRMQFETRPATVLSPSLLVEWNRFTLWARYFLGIRDSGDLAHAGFAKIGIRITWPWLVHLVAGAGNRADYLDLQGNPDAQFHWTVGGGVGWQVNWRWRLVLDVLYRDEQARGRAYRQLRTSLGTEVRF